jgi:hypothetical protein
MPKRHSILDKAIEHIDEQIKALQSAKQTILDEQRRAVESSKRKSTGPAKVHAAAST